MAMYEWPNQITEFQRTWVNQQQKLLADWIDTLQGMSGAGASRDMWRQAIDVMEQQVNSALDSQKQTLMSLASNTEAIEDMPEPVSQWLHQIEQGIELWSEVQHRLWQVWFDMLRTAAPQARPSPGESMLSYWQDLARQSMTIQEKWLSSLTGMQKPSEPKAGKSSTKSTASKQSSRASATSKKNES